MSTEIGGGVGKAPSFQFYASDFLTGTNDMTVDEVGIYIRMLATSWDKGPLPVEPSRLARVAGVEIDRFVPAWQVVRKKWKKTRAGYVNERLEEQRAARLAFTEKQAEKAQKRWSCNATAKPKHKPRHNRSNALQSSVSDLHSSNQETPKEQESPAPTRQLLALFDAEHREHIGKPAAIVGGRDAAILARVWKQQGTAETERLIRAFFAARDPWVHERGYTVNVFQGQVGKLLAAADVPFDDSDAQFERVMAGKGQLL